MRQASGSFMTDMRAFSAHLLFISQLRFWPFTTTNNTKSFRSIPVSLTCWIMSKVSMTMMVLSAPVPTLNPNFMYLPLPLPVGVPYLNQNVPFISYNIIMFLVF